MLKKIKKNKVHDKLKRERDAYVFPEPLTPAITIAEAETTQKEMQ